jgi:hypothetical protein
MWQNIIVFLVIGAIVAGAVAKIINDKRKGVKCPGCPYSKECSGSSICSPQTGFDAGQTGFDAGQTGFDAGQTGFDAGQTGFDAGQTGFDAGQTGFDTDENR